MDGAAPVKLLFRALVADASAESGLLPAVRAVARICW